MTHPGTERVESYQPNEQFRPFSNGEEFRRWIASNCQRGERGCRHYNPNAESSRDGCPIEVALSMASCGDGEIKAKVGLRGGFLEPGANGELVQPDYSEWTGECPEYKGYDEPDDRPRRGPKPPEGQQDLLDPRNSPLTISEPGREAIVDG